MGGNQMFLRKMKDDAKLLTEFLRFQGRAFKHPASAALEFYTEARCGLYRNCRAMGKAGLPVTAGSVGNLIPHLHSGNNYAIIMKKNGQYNFGNE